MLDAVLFDFDGVLVDSLQIKERVFGKLYQMHGEGVMNQVMAHHRMNGGMSRAEKFAYYHKTFLGCTLSQDTLHHLCKQFSQHVMELVIDADEMPYAADVLRCLCSKLPLHVISATPEIELGQIINARNMQYFFRSWHGSPEKKAKNIELTVLKNRYEKQRVLMIGDSFLDYEAALITAIKFIGYVPQGGLNPFPQDVLVVDDLRLINDYVI